MELNISKFLVQFFLEAREKLVNVQNEMVELEQNPRQREHLIQIQRDMHTIKGSSRMVGLKEVSALAHRMEDVFALLGGQGEEVTAPTMDTLYAAIDALSVVIDDAQANRPLADSQPVMDRLQQILDHRVKAPPADAQGTPAPASGEGGEGKKKFKLDFSALKRSVKVREAPAAPAAEPSPPPARTAAPRPASGADR
ncbi:MAG TPA: Hpt domain-containing protein, partial [Candidatus Aminicenantes bacterium]|nr:Hpt domain-containing protein [Candidatus Aminicenantes bacterium]